MFLNTYVVFILFHSMTFFMLCSKNWIYANIYCQDKHRASLVSVHSDEENAFVMKISRDSMWLGLESRGVFRGNLHQHIAISRQQFLQNIILHSLFKCFLSSRLCITYDDYKWPLKSKITCDLKAISILVRINEFSENLLA